MTLAILILADQMLFVIMVIVLVYQNIKVIPTLDVVLSVFSILIVQETRLVLEINVLILVRELVLLRQYVKLLTMYQIVDVPKEQEAMLLLIVLLTEVFSRS